MRSIIFVVIASSIAVNIWQCKSVDNSFCKTINKSKEDLRINLNRLFHQFNSNQKDEIRFLKIKEFLSRQECVDYVEIGKGYIRTQPPMKQVSITTSIDDTISKYIINVSINKNQGLAVESISKQEN